MKKAGIAFLALLLCLGGRPPVVLAEERSEVSAEETSPETEESNTRNTESDGTDSGMPEQDDEADAIRNDANAQYELSTVISTDSKSDFGEIRFLTDHGEWTVNNEMPGFNLFLSAGEIVRFAPNLKKSMECTAIAVDEDGNEEIIDGNTFTMPDHAVELRMEVHAPHVYANAKNGTIKVEVNGVDTDLAEPGDTVQLTFIPDQYYQVSPEDMYFVGKAQPEVQWNDNTCTFVMPEGGDLGVYEEFKWIPASFLDVYDDGQPFRYELTVNGEKADAARKGDEVRLTLTMDEGYYIDALIARNGFTQEETFKIENYKLKNVYTFDFTMPDFGLFLYPVVTEEFASYADENGTVYKVNAQEITSSTMLTLYTGWYFINDNVTINNRIKIKGDVNLILPDDMTLTCRNGIHNSEGNSLTIWGQENGTGYLDVRAPSYYRAGIGGNGDENGGTFILHGGRINSEAGEDGAGVGGGYRGDGGIIRIYGGYLHGHGNNNGAGIGGGEYGRGGDIRIYGGEVYGEGDKSDITDWFTAGGAGIGGGEDRDGGYIEINGGTVRALAGTGDIGAGAGIGGGDEGNGGTIIINGGSVTAKSDDDGAAIGGGNHGGAGTIEINGGNISAVSEYYGAGIGSGLGLVKVDGRITVNGGNINAQSKYGAGIGGGHDANSGTIELCGGTIIAKSGLSVAIGADSGTPDISLADRMKVEGYSIDDRYKVLRYLHYAKVCEAY